MDQLSEIKDFPNVLSINRKREAIRSFFKSKTTEFLQPFAFTLTLKQVLPALRIRLTPELAKQNCRHFLNVLNYKLFGKAYQRHGKRVKVVAVLEWSPGERYHYHGLMDCPAALDLYTLPDVVCDSWRKTQWGYHEAEIIPAYDRVGWLNYITKQSDLAEAIDWENCVIS